ncbi:PhzF family phenazine biosynthesis protein [Plasticicumulans lactativorans]|uniref:PhzF family phenazine biosynthesis protein n=1 Tax=Plasticicumulans lactativorans TaxID=1133106 RepID=A0A4R2L286_9GAMM|nr:PhzF family phenazine biosynthesis protein [Plasticicumulans lactativorans]TCO79752.1 PhzF family phenazine biosynthesis protein [Plasticicumulans lactativorans]
MPLELFQIDAFSARPFGGNPAAVVPLDAWLPDATLQAIAAENNLSETAFCVPAGAAWQLRWFTPTVEVELCGHATLATAHALYTHLGYSGAEALFDTRSGRLSVRRCADGRLELDLPARAAQPFAAPPALAAALGAVPQASLDAGAWLAVFADAAEVRALVPDLRALARLPCDGVIVTAAGSGAVDFVSRYFAPHAGIDEDPVTGSAHAVLTPYWAARLGRGRLSARQVSARGGELDCELDGARVRLRGHAVTYLRGVIELPD